MDKNIEKAIEELRKEAVIEAYCDKCGTKKTSSTAGATC